MSADVTRRFRRPDAAGSVAPRSTAASGASSALVEGGKMRTPEGGIPAASSTKSAANEAASPGEAARGTGSFAGADGSASRDATSASRPREKPTTKNASGLKARSFSYDATNEG